MKNAKKLKFDTWLYGKHAVMAFLTHHPNLVERVHYLGASHPDMTSLKGRYPHIHFQDVDKIFFNTFPKGHQKIAAYVCSQMPTPQLDEVVDQAGPALCLVALDGVTDPQNLGACIRIARAMNATGLLLPKHDSCELAPLVHKVAAGAAASLPIFNVTNLHQTLLKLKKMGVWVYGTSEHEIGLALPKVHPQGPNVIVMGSEGTGIRPVIKKIVDHMVAIPTTQAFPSLNVASACGIILYHFKHLNHE